MTAATDSDRSALDTVRAWLAAYESRDIDAALELTSAVIVVVDRDGEVQGHDELRARIARSSFTATDLRWFVGPDTVVVEQLATWVPPDSEMQAPPSGGVHVATAFSVFEGLITRIERFTDLEAALDEAWMTVDDALADPSS